MASSCHLRWQRGNKRAGRAQAEAKRALAATGPAPEARGQRDKLLDMLCSMYPLVPAHNHGWSSLTGVRPECQCPWHLNESTRHRRPVWCVHTGALMYRLAYQVNDSRDMLAGLHGFELRGDRPLPPPVIELSDSSDNNTDSTNNRAKRPRGAGPAAPSKWIML